MKKITSFIFTCAFLAGLTGLVGCQNNTDDEPGGSGNTGGTETASVNLAEGGIFGKMQDWKAENVKWDKADSSAGTYEYKFVAPAAEVEWKVLVKKGKTDEGAYVGDLQNKSNKWEVKVGGDVVPLSKAEKADDGSSLITKGLETGKEYKITVTVKDKEVSAKVERVPGPDLPKSSLDNGGIVGNMQEKPWDATALLPWKTKNDGVYTVEFEAKKSTVEWKVLGAKGAKADDYTNAYGSNSTDRYLIQLGAAALPIYKKGTGNLYTQGLMKGSKYIITVKVQGDQVVAAVKKVPGAPLAKGLLKDGGILGSMQNWKAADVKWTASNLTAGTYEYKFVAAAADVEWKVLVKKDVNQGAYLGDIENKNNKWVVNAGVESIPLSYAKKADDGGSLITKGLKTGIPYKITVKIEGDEVKASVAELPKEPLKKDLLKDGGILGAMQDWKAEDAKWTRSKPAEGTYEYDFKAPSSSVEWKVLVKKGKTDEGAYVGDLGNKDNKWGVFLDENNPISLNRAAKADDGSSLVLNGLTPGDPYTIVVKVFEDGVKAYAKEGTKPALAKDLLKDGGILGSMQDWKAADVKWTASTPSTGTYEYTFTAAAADVEWKVLVKKGMLDKGAYVGDVENKDNKWEVKVGTKAIRLSFAQNAENGGSLISYGLKKGFPYKITVKIDGGNVLASIQELPKDPLKIDMLKDGGVYGEMQGWDPETAKWTAKDPTKGKYEYTFTNKLAKEVQFKIAVKKVKDATEGAYVGDLDNLGNPWEIKFAETEALSLNYVKNAKDGGNLVLRSLKPNTPYTIVVKILGSEVKVYAEEAKKADLPKTLLQEGGFYGSLQDWNLEKAKWTAKNPPVGKYEYAFINKLAKEVEFKILVKSDKDASKGAYVGNIENKDDKWELKFDEKEALSLNFVDKVDDGGSLVLRNLKPNTPYAIIVKVIGSEVMAYVEEGKKAELPKTLLKDGGVYGAMQGWNSEKPSWTKKNESTGTYEYTLVADSSEAEFKILVQKDKDAAKGAYVGNIENKDDKWELKFAEKDALTLNYVDKAEDGGALVLRNLEVGYQYTIMVKVDGSDVKAYVKKGEKFALKSEMLKDGGIFGAMQAWKADEVKWDSKDTTKGTYVYKFVADSTEAEWKVLVKKGDLSGGALVGDLEKKDNKWEVKVDETVGQPLSYANSPDSGSSLVTKGLIIGDPYEISIKFEDKGFKAYVKKGMKAPLEKTLLKDGGIIGAMQNWNADNAKWTTANESAGTYNYVFVATAAHLEWKVLVKKGDTSKGAYVGDLQNKDNKWDVLVSNTMGVALNYANTPDNGSSLYSKDLTVGTKYKITLTIDNDKVMAKITSATDALTPEYDLTKGGIWGKMQGWQADAVKWDSSDKDSGSYTYKFTPTESNIEWKILLHKGKENEGVFAGDPTNKDNKWQVKTNGQEVGLGYALKASDISVLYTPDLVPNQQYTITVTVDGNRVTAKVEKK